MSIATRINSFWQREKPVFWLFLGIYAVLGLIYVFLGKFWADESWYFGESLLVASGHAPYQDFFTHHNPLFFYVYALPQYLFGPSIIVGRLTSLVLMLITFVLAWRLAYRLEGQKAALITGGLLVISIFLVYYYVTFSYRALEAFLTLVFFSILFGGLKDIVKYPLAAFPLCLIVAIRYPIDVVTAMLGLYLIYVIIHCWHRKPVILVSLGVTILVLGVILLPFIFIASEQYSFGTITYTFRTTDFWAEFGIMGVPTIIDRLYHALLVLTQVIRNYYAVVVIILGLLIFSIYKIKLENPKLKELISRNQNLVIMIIFILLFELFCAMAFLSGVGLRTFSFPVAAILAGVGLGKVLDEVKDKGTVWMLNGLIIALIIFTPLAQYGQGDEARPALKWQNADINYILDVSDKIADYTQEGESVLTFTPPLVLQADRKLMPGMAMELLNFFPTWDTEKARKYHLYNKDILMDYLTSRQAAAVVLTENRFYSGKGQGKILDDYRGELLRILNDNYSLVETLYYPLEIGRGNVYIYLPRSP